ncbi:hypothetical protein [Azorhizobium oxalatiphilum]|uniref:hypothetical protein n=1 Tax=Azorhizobium oxalatiphilum TaxID=980631 RepID=UPI00166C037D|nr:hypothetical protein [Azorhizobium oxalatiphilum]
MAQAQTLRRQGAGADCDVDARRKGKEKTFNFVAHRRPELCRRLVDQVGAVLPE